MAIKNYIIATILLLILLFGFIHSLELGEYTISLFGFSQTLPATVWIVVPVLFLGVMSTLHMIYHGVIIYFKSKLMSMDQEQIIDFLSAKLLDKDYKANFKTKKFKELSSILNQFEIGVKKESFSSSSEDLNKVVSSIQNINNGLYVRERDLKIDENSSLAQANLINKINEQVDFAVEIVKKAEKYDFKVVKIAFLKVLDEKSMTTVKKIYKNVNLDKELACKLFEKDIKNEEFGFENIEILDILKNIKLTKDEYVELAKNYKSSLNPDKLIELFENLSLENEDATTAYLYVLNDFEMIDKLREVLANSSNEDYLPFKALIDLKDSGKHYTIENLTL